MGFVKAANWAQEIRKCLWWAGRRERQNLGFIGPERKHPVGEEGRGWVRLLERLGRALTLACATRRSLVPVASPRWA